MSRRTDTVVVDAAGRDAGKTFLITEMPAAQAEEWAIRAFLALAQSGAKVPDDLMTAGMAGIAVAGITGLQGLPWGLAQPLLRELMDCVAFVPQPSKPLVTMKDVDNHVEEVSTRLMLRARAFVLHTGFSWADVQSRLADAAAKKAPGQSAENLPDSPTSPPASG